MRRLTLTRSLTLTLTPTLTLSPTLAPALTLPLTLTLTQALTRREEVGRRMAEVRIRPRERVDKAEVDSILSDLAQSERCPICRACSEIRTRLPHARVCSAVLCGAVSALYSVLWFCVPPSRQEPAVDSGL